VIAIRSAFDRHSRIVAERQPYRGSEAAYAQQGGEERGTLTPAATLGEL